MGAGLGAVKASVSCAGTQAGEQRSNQHYDNSAGHHQPICKQTAHQGCTPRLRCALAIPLAEGDTCGLAEPAPWCLLVGVVRRPCVKAACFMGINIFVNGAGGYTKL